MTDRLSIILGAPGEAEMPLLADLGARDDCEIVAVIDATGRSLGAAIAEIMGLPVVPSLDVLDLPAGRELLFVLPEGLGSLAATLGAAAASRGLTTIRAEELRARLFANRPPRQQRLVAPIRRPGLEEIERESAALQASIIGLEDALAGDTILRQLVDLCTRATGASGGSLLLFDEVSRELYIAFATGLSEGTLHGTRIKLGEGIAGRVAHTRQPELLRGAQGACGRLRDRPDIASAVCTPLIAGERLLGVLNVSTQAGETPLDEHARDVLAGLSLRLGRILDGVQSLQQQRTSRMFDLTEQQLRRLAAGRPELPAMLADWCQALAVTAEATRVTLVVPCEDGSLLVAEGTGGPERDHWYEPLHNQAWLEVLATGLPVVARQTDLAGEQAAPLTVFYLPIGRQPVLAGLAVHFANSRLAHGFHALAGEMLFLLERLLIDQLAQRRQAGRADRLAELSCALADLATHEGTPGQLGEKICASARQSTGARFVAAVASIDGDLVRLAGGNIPATAGWLLELPRLLRSAAREGWRITTLEVGSNPLSVLVAVSRPGAPAPGLVLLGKQRRHALDGQVFTPLDAEIVLPLAAAISQVVPAAAATIPLELLAKTAATGPTPATGGSAGADTSQARLLDDLRRELDRCDRYHNVCGLVLLRPALPASTAIDLLAAAARRIADHLRNSDRCYPLPDGCLAVLVPEDVQHLDRLQVRLQDALRDLAGQPDLPIDAARLAYPVTKGTAAELLACARERLDR